MKTTSKMKATSKIKMTSNVKMAKKMKTTSEKFPTTPKIFAPSLLVWYYLFFLLLTSFLDSHTTTDFKPEMLTGLQTENRIPHDEYNIRVITHLHLYRKDNIFVQTGLVQSFTCIREWKQGTKSPKFFCKRCNNLTTHTLTKHTRALRNFFFS